MCNMLRWVQGSQALLLGTVFLLLFMLIIPRESVASNSDLSSMDVQAVIRAVYEGNNDYLTRLIEKYDGEVLGVKLPTKKGGVGLLLIASAKGNVDIVNTLLSYGADVNEIGLGGYRSIHNAAVNCNLALTKLLVVSGAELDAQTDLGITPLMGAAILGCKDVLLELLNHGADTQILSNEGRTALDYAKIKGWVEITKLLEAADVGNKPKSIVGQ